MQLLRNVQKEIKQCMHENGVKQTPQLMLLGAVEEIGEASHAMLKNAQGIRGFDDIEKYHTALKDAIGDTVIYLSQLCEEMGWNLDEVLVDTAAHVLARNGYKMLVSKKGE